MNTSSRLAAAVSALLLATGIGLAAGGAHRAAPSLRSSQAAAGLRSVLAEYDRQIAALRATLHPAAFPNSTAEIDAATNALRSEIGTAAVQVDRVVTARAAEYAVRQDAAAGAILASHPGTAPSRSDIARHVQDAYRAEYTALRSGADSDMNAYQRAVTSQEQHAYRTFVASVERRTQQAYFNRAQELREQESTLLLDLARKDAPQRMNLRAKLQTLALSGQRRANLQARLAAIQANEDGVLAARRARDAVTLDAYRSTLLTQANRDVAGMSVQLQTRAQANLAARRDVLAAQRAQAAALPIGTGSTSPAASPDLRSKVAALRNRGAQAFRDDAQATIAAYTGARDDIVARFADVRARDAGSLASTLTAIAQLQRDRAELAAQLAVH